MILIHQQVALVVYYFHPCFSISNKSSGLQEVTIFIFCHAKYGGFFCNDIHACTPLKQLKDAVFMLLLPLDQIRDEEAVWYEEQNGWKTITYSSGAFFAVNFETQECRVRIDGQLWIQNGTATIPQPDGSLLVYVCWEEPYLPIHLPCDLAPGSAVIAKPLAPETPEEILHVSEDGLPLSLPPGRAYRVRVQY
jgi:hypothetical protein